MTKEEELEALADLALAAIRITIETMEVFFNFFEQKGRWPNQLESDKFNAELKTAIKNGSLTAVKDAALKSFWED